MIKSDKQLRQEAIAVLVELGVCRYLKDIDLYHGRANSDGKRFSVRNLDNSGDNTGNRNVSSMSGLYTAKKDIATEFAEIRARFKGGKAELHKIVGINEDDVIFDLTFEKSFISEKDMPRLARAFRVLTNFSVSNLLPINFDYKDVYYSVIFPVLRELATPLLSYRKENDVVKQAKKRFEEVKSKLKSDGDIDKLRNLDIDDKTFERLVRNYISARNTRILLRVVPFDVLDKASDGKDVFYNDEYYSLNGRYVSAWIANNHIAGFKYLVNSATLGKKIDICHLVNVQQIMTERDFGEYYQNLMQLEEVATKRFSDLIPAEFEEFFASASGWELVWLASKDAECKALYDKKAGIWEGWTVGQHTASVVDFFDAYYSDSLPDNMQSIMKLILLAHDIGKGVASEKHFSQELENQRNVDTLLDSLEIKKGVKDIVKFAIGEGQRYTSSILIQENEEQKDKMVSQGLLNEGNRYDREKRLIKQMNEKCAEVLKKAFGESPKQEEVDVLRNLCLILQFCDSGAYTYYAKINEGQAYVTGGNARFTRSFEQTNKNTPLLKKSQKLGLVLTTNQRLLQSQDEISLPLRVL